LIAEAMQREADLIPIPANGWMTISSA